MVSGALIGAVCGIASGLLFGVVCCLICLCLKKRNDTSRIRNRKKSIPLPGPSIIKPTIPPFAVPDLPLVPIQQPIKPVDHLLSPPCSPRTPEGSKIHNGSRRSSVQLDFIITSASTRDSPPDRIKSPKGVRATNESAIASLYTRQRKIIGKNVLKKSSGGSCLLGKLEFSLFYDQSAQELQICVVRGLQVYIPGMDGQYNLVVMAVVLLDGEEFWQDKTDPAEGCSDPDFSYQLIVHGLSAKKMRKGLLRLIVLDDITGDAASEVVYPLSNLPFNQFTSKTLKLTELEEIDFGFGQNNQEADVNSNLGKLYISMYHNRNEKTLSIGVECAEGLPDMTRNNSVDSFVKVSVMYFGKKLCSTRSTKVVYKTRNPDYLEEFDFVIADDKLPQITVFFKVKHHGTMRDAAIGMVKLGHDADAEYRHLEQVLDKPHLCIGHWHDIRKYQ